MPKRELDYLGLLGELVALQGRQCVVTYSVESIAVFSFFDAAIERGTDAVAADLLGHDSESVEFEFSNGVKLTLDPTLYKHGEVEESDGTVLLRIHIGEVQINLIMVPGAEA